MVTGMTYGIEIANSATNIEIRGCNIILIHYQPITIYMLRSINQTMAL